MNTRFEQYIQHFNDDDVWNSGCNNGIAGGGWL